MAHLAAVVVAMADRTGTATALAEAVASRGSTAPPAAVEGMEAAAAATTTATRSGHDTRSVVRRRGCVGRVLVWAWGRQTCSACERKMP